MLRPLASLGLTIVLLSSVSAPLASSEEELLAADRAFAAAATADGIDGWMSFFGADAARMPRFGGEIVAGGDAIRALDQPLLDSPEVQLRWQPVRAHEFGDGLHGITTGTYQVVSRADGSVVGTGRYLTLWAREADGWKVMFDTGVAD